MVKGSFARSARCGCRRARPRRRPAAPGRSGAVEAWRTVHCRPSSWCAGSPSAVRRRHKGQSGHAGFSSLTLVSPAAPRRVAAGLWQAAAPRKARRSSGCTRSWWLFPEVHDPAVGQETGGLEDSERPCGVLFYQEDGVPDAGETADDVEDFVGDVGARPRLGSSRSKRGRGPGHKSPADGHHLLLAPGKGGGGLLDPFPELRKTAPDLV